MPAPHAPARREGGRPSARAPRPRAIVAVEAVAFAVFAALAAALVWRVAACLDGVGPLVTGLVAATLGYLAADVATGTVHWFCDRFFEEDTPVIGRLLIFPFRDHHRDPRAMTRHGFLELTGNSCLATAPAVGATLAWPAGLFVDAFVAAFALAAFATNLLHRWAHAATAPWLVARLQARGLVLAPAAHAVHHALPSRGAYCVTSGWANRWLDRFGVFERLEQVLSALGLPAARAA
jgi:ubiquitin-conjugating enzyme E2 variant